MAYHNCSFRSAERILAGKETQSLQVYDRYEDPEKWPRLTTLKNTGTREKHIERRMEEQKIEGRKSTQSIEERREEERKRRN